jgi:hypothetical protein
VERKLFRNLQNMWGPLNESVKRRLSRLIENPDADSWSDAHCLIIGADGWTTLWQSVCAVDINFPRSARMSEDGLHKVAWDKIPDQMTILRALKYAREIKRKVNDGSSG